MEPVKTSLVLALLWATVGCAIELQAPETTGRNSTARDRQILPKGMECGIPKTAPNYSEGRIVGGAEAVPHSWPWQVFLECMYVRNGLQVVRYCGGSIISDRWIITAAHCLNIDNVDIRLSCKLYLGKHKFEHGESTELIVNIADYLIHEEYDPADPDHINDLALIKLAKPVKFTDAIQPICLPFGNRDLPFHKRCIATGWGRTEYENEDSPDELRQLTLTVLPDEKCFKDRIICTTSWDESKDPCKGDSGGPLACKEDDGKWYLRGVTSTVRDKCQLDAFFTEVNAFEKWIKNIISRN